MAPLSPLGYGGATRCAPRSALGAAIAVRDLLMFHDRQGEALPMPRWFRRRRGAVPPFTPLGQPGPVTAETGGRAGSTRQPPAGRCGEGLGLELLSDPLQVAAALADDRRGPAQWWVRGSRLGYAYDPDMHAHRDSDGT
jgi:hypothetical protein